MKRLTILSIVAILILSGCIGKTTDNKNDTKIQSTVVNDNRSDTKSGIVDANIEDNTQSIGGKDTKTNSASSETGSEWCTPGSKITVDLPSGLAEFTIVGIMTYTDDNGKSYDGLCKAERVIKDGSSVRYFNKEGTIDIMKSESSSKSGSSHAESSASASVSAK